MSFFGALLGGAMSGVGAGMASMGADEERLAEKRMLAQERHQQNLELQRQRSEDRMMQAEQLQALKGPSGGRRGGGDGINLAEMMMQAKTPEEQQQVVRLARTFGGDDVAGLLSEQMYGRPMTSTTNATAGDFARYDRAGEMDAPPPTATVERAAYDADKGRQALQRLYALALDPAKTDDFAKAERQFGLNDFGQAVAGDTLKRGGSLAEAATGFSQYSSPKDETAKNDLARERIDATRERTAATDSNADANRKSAERRKLQDLLLKAQGAKEDMLNPSAKAEKAATVGRLQAQLDALDSERWVGNSPAAAGDSRQLPPAPFAPRKPSEAARAFKYQPGSVTAR
jgi:hypothetical protein